jgi:hypothetical protein
MVIGRAEALPPTMSISSPCCAEAAKGSRRDRRIANQRSGVFMGRSSGIRSNRGWEGITA